MLLQYGESFKAALKLGIEDCFDGQETSRNFSSDIWNRVVNVAVSVAIGAVLGFGLGFLVSGSLAGAIPTALCFAIGSGIVSYQNGEIAIGYSKKS